MKIDFTYNKEKIDYIEGYILKGAFYRCNYTRFKTLYDKPYKGTENVQLYNFEPKGNIEASIFIVPGLGSRNIKFLLWMGTHLASAGIHSTIIVLPGNYTRVEDNSVSGKSFIKPDIKTMYRFWEHAVVDILSSIDLLEQKGVWKENNCLMGYCLGGMLSFIVSALDKRFNQTIFMTTGGYFPKIIHKSKVTKFARRIFKNGFIDNSFYIHDKKRLYSTYETQFPKIKEASLLEILNSEKFHPLFRIDPISYAHLLDKSKITFIDALFDETIPLYSKAVLFNEMSGSKRYIIPMTHVSWLPFERFLSEYILLKLNMNNRHYRKLVLKKQNLNFPFIDYLSKWKNNN